MHKQIKDRLEAIYNNFDFGYNVAVITANDWKEETENLYIKKVFLEQLDSSFSTPHITTLMVRFEGPNSFINCMTDEGYLYTNNTFF